MGDDPPAPLIARSLLLGSAVCYWCFSFFLRAAPTSFLDDLRADFDLTASGAGTLASAYFFSYSLVTVFIGPVFDRYGALRVLMVSSLGCAFGSIIFTLPSIWCAYLGRLLVGVFCSGSWLCCVTIAAKCFPANSDSLVGFAFFGGMVGGAIAQAPLLHAIAALDGSWRTAMRISAFVPLACWIGLCYLAQRYPGLCDLTMTGLKPSLPPAKGNGGDEVKDVAKSTRHAPSILCPRELVEGYMKCRNWMFLFYGLCTFSVLLGFTSLWSTPFLITVGGYGPSTASIISSVTKICIGIFTPAWGRISELYSVRRSPMLATAAAATAAMSCLVFTGHGILRHLTVVVLLYAAIGMAFGAHSILAYSVVRKTSEAEGRAVGVDLSIFNLGTVMSGAVFQPLVGILLDASWKGEKDGDGARLYSNQDYMNALSVFPAAMGTCVILLAFCFPTDVSLEDASPAERDSKGHDREQLDVTNAAEETDL